MSFAIAPFFICLFLLLRLRKLAKHNDAPDLEKLFKYAVFVPVIILAVQAPFQKIFFTRFIWDVLMVLIVVYAYRQTRIKVPRMLLWGFIPYIILNIAGDIVETTHLAVFKNWDDYIDNALGLAFMWMLAIIFTQNRQQKILEKERIKKIISSSS